MSANARGSYNERFVASKLAGGRKVSERGKEGHDVESRPYVLRKPIWQWEAKYREELPKWLKEWQEQSIRQGTPVIFRETRGDMWVMMHIDWLKPGTTTDSSVDLEPEAVYINGRKFVPE